MFKFLRELPADLGLHRTAFDDQQGTRFLEAAGLICKAVSANPGSIAAGAEGSTTVAVAGAQIGMRVFATLGADVTVGLSLRSAHVSAVGVVTLYYDNTSGGSIDEAAHTVNLLLIPGDLN